MSKCTLCPLHAHAQTNKMSGSGPEYPVWLFVGEAPGANEDREGEPFVGKYGLALRAILEQGGFDLERVGFTNASRCWPGPGNPTPTSTEIAACKPFLIEEIKQRKPKVIVLLGACASESILGQKAITKIRGNLTYVDFDGLKIPVFPTYHPGYVARSPKDRLKVWAEDLQEIKAIGDGEKTKVKLHPGWVVAKKRDIINSTFKLLAKWDTVPTIDFEWYGEPWDKDSKLLSVGIAFSPTFSVCIPIFKSDSPFNLEEQQEILNEMLTAFKQRAKLNFPVDAYNGQADMGWILGKYPGSILPKLSRDGYLAEHLLYEETKNPSLSTLAYKYTEYGGYDSFVKRKIIEEPEKYNPSKGGSFDNFTLDELGPYNAADAAVSMIIANKQDEIMGSKPKMAWLYKNVVVPANWVVAEFRNNGVKIDTKLAKELSDSYPRRIAKLKEDMRLCVPSIEKLEQKYIDEKKETFKKKKLEWHLKEKERLAKGMKPRKPMKIPKFEFEYLPTSHFHNREIIFEMDGVKPAGEFLSNGKWNPWLTKTAKQPSLDEAAREQLMDKHPLVPFLDEFATINKLYGSYIKRLSNVDCNDLFHPWFDLTRTVTGRMGSDLQQLPSTEKSKDIKKLIISRFPEGQLLNVDVSQGELRILAIVSRDEKFKEVFAQGGDAHTAVATKVYRVTAEEVTTAMRRSCKTIGFGTIYGQGIEALAKSLGWTKEKAKRFQSDYFRVYSGADSLIKWLKMYAAEHGYVYNLMGRERNLPDAQLNPNNEDNRAKLGYALRRAVNFPIQSLLHDMILWAEYAILMAFKRFELKSLLVAEIHDSIVVDVHPGELEIVKVIVKTILENMPFDWITVPIVADVQVGPNLAEMEEV